MIPQHVPVSDFLPQLRWQCRRGLLELDVLLGTFLEAQYAQLSMAEKTAFMQLLTYPDAQLLDWLMDQSSPPAPLVFLINAIKHQKMTAPRCAS